MLAREALGKPLVLLLLAGDVVHEEQSFFEAYGPGPERVQARRLGRDAAQVRHGGCGLEHLLDSPDAPGRAPKEDA